MANMMILFFLFSEGKTEDSLTHIFNLFDADGNRVRFFSFQIYLKGQGHKIWFGLKWYHWKDLDE